MKKIIVTGATGLLGRTLMQVLAQSHTVIGTGFSRAKAPIEQLDLNQETAIVNFLDKHQPDVLIHAAAERKPDICENDHQATIALNVKAAEFLANQCKARKIHFVFISTDYVFDGKSAPYLENSSHSPVNFYGQSKAQAEQAILSNSARHTIIRVPVLYGEVEYLAESAVTVIAQQILTQSNSKHDDWAIRFPTHVEDIALTLRALLQQPESSIGGIFHISDNQSMTKYGMAKHIAHAVGRDPEDLVSIPEPTQSAMRPYNCALKDTRLAALNIQFTRDFADAIKQVLTPHLAQ
ncbi:SDR family oxidoreductase [Pseudoalteromonas luteoviolacea]|uniref:dTDP-4-dehydrorhamnose reductase family protein n=1 Tax=Pseudoalteromonas luteoviolacea TaxID=43657 RepID=UPI001B37331E|nr:SDR family oxidoreductase [Pseudoalteromonas luteoviolacea]MBQ4812772.1 SDR family oxidoreductase [Pseudoalteromonas luteoviolacea]